jgi:hypothetical protein
MKKIILSGIALLAVAVVAAINVNLGSRSNELSDISLANVEALADPECNAKQGDPCYKGSYNSNLPLAVSCGTPCTMDHKGGVTDKCS